MAQNIQNTLQQYNPADFSKKEIELVRIFKLQRDDAKSYFETCIKPRLDRSYKLYIAYNGDRAKEIKKWQCISEDTEILSLDGWKKNGELKKGDSVFSFDIETNDIKDDIVSAIHEYKLNNETVVSICNYITDQLITTNHRALIKKCGKKNKLEGNGRQRMWGKYQYMEASDLSKGAADYRIPVSGFYDGDLSVGDDIAELIGWFLSDGCIPDKGVPYITQSKPITQKELIRLLNRLGKDGLQYREWSRKKGKRKNGGDYFDEHRFYISRKDPIMKKIIDLIPGRLPSNKLFRLKLSEKSRLLKGIFLGDGSRRPEDNEFSTVHEPRKEFQDWLQIMVHLSGHRCVTSKNGKYSNIAQKKTVDIYGKLHIRELKYTGKVWSVTTTRSNYIAKRNGKVFITGNSNVSVPYVHSVVETLMPRILDARPEFTVQGRTEDDQLKVGKLQQLVDWTWEIAKADQATELLTRSALIYGTGYLQVSWKVDKRRLNFLKTQDLSKKKYNWENREETFYDAPYLEWVDNYSLWYDWHNVDGASKQYWFKRLILTTAEIKRRYPMAEKKRLDFLNSSSGELTDYSAIRNQVKLTQEQIIKGADYSTAGYDAGSGRYKDMGGVDSGDSDLKMHEVFEWWRPFEDAYAVMVDDVPILKGASIPNPYDFKESPFIDIPYLRVPGEFEGYGLPMILENPQIMLNTVKNQRLDAASLNIHKMWVVNPLANVNKEELVTRPFGIVYSVDPNGVREIQFSDVKASAYKEEEMLKSDMRYASGVDDFSMGAGGGGASATEVRHLRESTLERVRLFVNHLGEGFSKVMRYWICMHRQFFTKEMTIRVIGDDGAEIFPIIEKDDLMGKFDYKAAVMPSIAGMNDVKKKQDMDLFQLLINLPFVDPRKLVSKILYDWNWNVESISKGEEEAMPPEGMPPEEGAMPGGMPMEGMPGMPGGLPMPIAEQGAASPTTKEIPPDVLKGALELLRGRLPETANQPSAAALPINLLRTAGPPPTAQGIKTATTNPRGMNRSAGGGSPAKVNTNINLNNNSNPESALMNRTFSLQR